MHPDDYGLMTYDSKKVKASKGKNNQAPNSKLQIITKFKMIKFARSLDILELNIN